jgi:hypothetical protein
MIGHKACNRRYFEEAHPELSFKWTVDDSLSDGCFAVSFK